MFLSQRKGPPHTSYAERARSAVNIIFISADFETKSNKRLILLAYAISTQHVVFRELANKHLLYIMVILTCPWSVEETGGWSAVDVP